MPDPSPVDRALPTEVRMRVPSPVLRTILVVSAILASAATAAEPATQAQPPTPNETTLNFAVLRNGAQIGTSTMRVRRDGDETVAETVTRIQVKIAFVTVYRFDQSQTERWADGNLVAFTSVTDDNGTTHKITAERKGDTLSVETGGKTSEVDPTVIPASLWNAALARQRVALDPRDGSVTPVSVVDHGEEKLVLDGRPTTARHYSISTGTGTPEDVWFDEQNRLAKVELRGRDGSKIEYRRS
jgi:hypothetical protein